MRFGYACRNLTLMAQGHKRRMLQKKQFESGGLTLVSEVALHNLEHLRLTLLWNQQHGIRLFRWTDLFPWMDKYTFESLPQWPLIQQKLIEIGNLATSLGHRLTNHPSEFCVLASPKPECVQNSVGDINQSSRIFDLMGLQPSPFNKINIHMAGVYGSKTETAKRFIHTYHNLLSTALQKRITIENEDRLNGFNVKDLYELVYTQIGIPIVFDFFHHEFNDGGLSDEEALKLAASTWPEGVAPVVHYSDSRKEYEDHKAPKTAHSEKIQNQIENYGINFDLMIEAKGTELAVIEANQKGLLPIGEANENDRPH